MTAALCVGCRVRQRGETTRCERCRVLHNEDMRERLVSQREKSEYTIYLLWNRASRKGYVGVTARTLAQRLNGHLTATRGRSQDSCRALNAAIRKYGIESFTSEVVTVLDNEADASAAECYYIEQLGTMSPKGYNIREGGYAGARWSAETRARQSVAHKARWAAMTPERRAEIRAHVIAARAKMPAGQRRANAVKASYIALARFTPAQRQARQVRAAATRLASTTHAQRSAWAKKTWQTRKLKYGSNGGNVGAPKPKGVAERTWKTRRDKYGSSGRRSGGRSQ